MEDEEGYMMLNLRPKEGGSAVPAPARIQGPPLNPQRHRRALCAVCVVICVLVVTVIALGIWVFQLVSEKGQTPAAPDSHGAGSEDTSTPPGSGDTCTANCIARLEHFRSQLTQNLCHPAQPGPAGGSGCKLCPTDWRLRGDKCYWVSRDSKTWSESCADCSARGSQLLVIRDREELEFLKYLTQGTSEFWVGLSVPSPQKAWVWLDGFRLNLTRFPGLGQAEENSCGTLKGNQIRSDSCSSVFQWICQRDAVLL
ncbi:killer cell lectin-like receptor subfamily B member 1B allele C [Emydura macquarii macquarii]|uniref:killer cell lectin-like receptor subfamily B member 1B allele C n=1 Tax=Emydura macquarii macquarii TaxID=1129001 RepID=UPI00352A974A